MTSASQIQENAAQFPNQLALDGAAGKLSYRELDNKAKTVAQHLLAGDKNRKIGLWGQKVASTYTSLLGVHYAAHCYTPFLPYWPKDRLQAMANALELKEIIYNSGELEEFAEFCQSRNQNELKIYVHDSQTKKSLLQLGLKNQIEIFESTSSDFQSLTPSNEELAYILFTSGSTGRPKGVPISRENLSSYLKNFKQHYSIEKEDRLSHTFELSFDLSVHDIFVTWSSGATLCVPSHEELMLPHSYIQQQNLSVWFSVPTLVTHMQKLGLFEHFSFPNLKQSFFCGEPLFEQSARTWQKAAPNSSVVNLYGPTEATIAYTHYQLPSEKEPAKSQNSILAIGKPFHGLKTKFEDGELILMGEQVTYGYLNNPEKTKASFFTNEKNENAYRTGDLCTIDEQGDLFFKTRADHQVKIHGHRIELFEIEAVVKEVTKKQHCYCVAKKDESGVPQSIIAVLDTQAQESDGHLLSNAQRQKIQKRLPSYMVPEKYIGLETFPTNSSGKIDRKELERMLVAPTLEDRG